MSDQRIQPRRRTLKGGSISFAGGVIDCIIRNMSDTGACLELPAMHMVPERFKLIVKPERTTRDCRVQWRVSQKIGVNFV